MLDDLMVWHTHIMNTHAGNVNEQECQESLIYTLHIDETKHY